MGSCAAPSAKGDDKFITTDYLQQCPLRRSEVTTITIEDIDPAHRLIRIRAENTKGKRERVVCYGPAITPVLAAHLRNLRQTGITGGALFRSFSDRNYGSPLSYWSWR
ncbi:tyrosine-type recombinase/integrase [Enterobacter hormaechei]|uniref:tyrosine-type recombinase/integrase n=1 Tax=Enterobacter hormaechei TaxID=158836 RepID=UPI003D0404CA